MPHQETKKTKRQEDNYFSSSPPDVRSSIRLIACFLSVGLLTASCGESVEESAKAQQQQGANGQANGITPVDVGIARTGLLRQELEYTGTTVPYRSVSLRSQVEGRLLALNVDVGYAVKGGQVIGQLDDALLLTALKQAEAELAALKSEVARARTQVSNARAEVERLRLVVVQAQADSERQQKLLKEGAIAAQLAEQARTESLTATQALRAATEAVRTEQQAVAAAQGRVVAQQAVVAEAKERRSYARLTSPIAGVITEKLTEPGNLLQPGNEILRIGDFSRAKVVVQVSELELGKIQAEQSVEVRLDAFPNETLIGRVTRISPAADATARLVPVEVVIPNSNGKIGSGLLARVNFQSDTQQRVVVPQTAIQAGDMQERSQVNNSASSQNLRSVAGARESAFGGRSLGTRQSQNRQGRVFVLTQQNGNQAKVSERAVILGEKGDGKVEILSGLRPGEQYVVRSGKPLKNGEAVRLSILSEKLPNAASDSKSALPGSSKGTRQNPKNN